ncbi:MAG: tRNA uridine-5-carboxymethylaminomethyl(34) synthesis GTPase MnmE [Desulfobacterales bacterium]
MKQDTIAAIATPLGTGGIGIIKISGTEAFRIVSALFQRSGESRTEHPPASTFAAYPKSRRIFHGFIHDPSNGHVVDEVLVTMMPGPKSYTCEDVVEINTHSGALALKHVLGLVLKQGARLALPGEFTKRAFLNGRIDLTQAEAVIDIIEAKTNCGLRLAAMQARGALGKAVEDVLEHLSSVIIDIEAHIDFPEDLEGDINTDEACYVIEQDVVRPLRTLLSQFEVGRLIKYGVRTLIVGKPNVGKSSLMNCLLKKDRVIVSPVPGTTRDFIEQESRLETLPVIFVDTAGLHETGDLIENIGITKTYEHIEEADIVLHVLDMSNPLSKEDVAIQDRIRSKIHILVMNKMDLAGDSSFDIPEDWCHSAAVQTSALYCRGIEDLEKRIFDCATENKEIDVGADGVAINVRHKQAIEYALRCIEAGLSGLRENSYPELIAIDLREGITYLEDIIGLNIKNDVLEQVFEKFCIGK